MFGNRGSRIASAIIARLPTSRWHGVKRFLLRKLGGIEVGDETEIWSGARFNGVGIHIGRHCHIGEGCSFTAPDPSVRLTIGDNTSFGPEVYITTGTHTNEPGSDNFTNGLHLPVTIGDRCNLSLRCMVMAGVTIGDGCHITPGVCVSRNIKPKTIVASAPVRRMPLG